MLSSTTTTKIDVYILLLFVRNCFYALLLAFLFWLQIVQCSSCLYDFYVMNVLLFIRFCVVRNSQLNNNSINIIVVWRSVVSTLSLSMAYIWRLHFEKFISKYSHWATYLWFFSSSCNNYLWSNSTELWCDAFLVELKNVTHYYIFLRFVSFFFFFSFFFFLVCVCVECDSSDSFW